MEQLNLLALNGFLGYGYELESLENGLDFAPAMLGCDAGSTDAGPFYLGSGSQLVREAQVRRDLRHALQGARRLGVPLLIGSAGTAGGEPHLQSLLTAVRLLAAEDHLHFKLAQIHAEIDKNIVLQALTEQRIESMPGAPSLTARAVQRSERIVGQMGTEPFIRALRHGAEVIVAGRQDQDILADEVRMQVPFVQLEGEIEGGHRLVGVENVHQVADAPGLHAALQAGGIRKSGFLKDVEGLSAAGAGPANRDDRPIDRQLRHP